MTDQEIAEVGGAFSSYLRRYRGCFLQRRTAEHFDNYCRGLLSDLPRKSVEPIALTCGTAVRTLQEFLVTANWDHLGARAILQRHIAQTLRFLPADPLGTVGVIDETSATKKGDKTPGVQRQHLGCAGKIDNGIVTVHIGVARGRFQALLDCDLYLPQKWDQDRDRCDEAGIPDEVRYQPKWQIALDQLLRLDAAGIHFDWLTFDEGYGSKVPFLSLLSLMGQRFVAEVPVNLAVCLNEVIPSLRADQALTVADARAGVRVRIPRQTGPDQWWRAASLRVYVGGHKYLLVVATNESSGEVKYFLSNAPGEPLRAILLVAFRRASIEHGFRLAKQEAGLMHYEGRHYAGLMRHLILALIVLGFVSIHTNRLRGGKPTADRGASVPGAEPAVCHTVAPTPGHLADGACRLRHSLPPAPQCFGHSFSSPTAA